MKRAKERGAKVVRDVYEESDEHGTVKFATLQTVLIFINLNVD